MEGMRGSRKPNGIQSAHNKERTVILPDRMKRPWQIAMVIIAIAVIAYVFLT